MRRPRSLMTLALLAVVVVGLASTACGGDDEGGGSGAPDEERVVTIDVSEGCREAWYESGEARYRARDLPEGWQPGDRKEGTMRFESDNAAIFEASDGSGTATFTGGDGVAFTADCPLWPDAAG